MLLKWCKEYITFWKGKKILALKVLMTKIEEYDVVILNKRVV